VPDVLRRALPAVLLLAASAAPAFADDESEARKAIRELIDDFAAQRNNLRQLEQKAAILKCRNAAELFVEETLAHPGRREDRGEFGTTLLYVFSNRRDDFVEPVRRLFRDPSEDVACWGLKLATDLEIGPKVASDLVGLFDREDEAVLGIRNRVFRGVEDPKVVERLIAEAGKSGDRADAALGALGDIETPAAHACLRGIAVSESESAVRRDWAFQGLAPFIDAEDERVALDGLASADGKLATAAFLAFCNSRKAPPPAILRKARPKIWDQMSDEVDEMLVLGGDGEIVEDLLKRARESSDTQERLKLLERAALSPLPTRAAKFGKALEGETDPWCQEALLLALGGSGDPAAWDTIVVRLSSEDAGEAAAKALAALVRSRGTERKAAIQRIIEENQPGLLSTFDGAWLGPDPTEIDRLDLAAFLVDLLEKNAARRPVRLTLIGGLIDLASEDFGEERSDVPKWREWLKEEQRKARKD